MAFRHLYAVPSERSEEILWDLLAKSAILLKNCSLIMVELSSTIVAYHCSLQLLSLLEGYMGQGHCRLNFETFVQQDSSVG